MMLANIPAVLIGDQIADKLPVKPIGITAAIVFAIIGVLTLAGSKNERHIRGGAVQSRDICPRIITRCKSCPGLTRASTLHKLWIAGSSPAMTIVGGAAREDP